jgi:hypothetical protein
MFQMQVPGDIVVQTHIKGRDYCQAYKLIALPKVVGTDENPNLLELSVSSWQFDGTHRLLESSLSIARAQFNEALLPIGLLPVLPLGFAEYRLRKYLEHRGNKLWSLRNGGYVSYSGPIADSKEVLASDPLPHCLLLRLQVITA